MAFHKATKSWIKQLDPNGDWNYLQNVTDHEDFRVLSLVQLRRRTHPWQTCCFRKTSYLLEDVLLSRDNIASLDVRESGPYTVVDKATRKGKGDVGGGADIASANVTASARESHDWQVNLKKKSIPEHRLHPLEKNINMENKFITRFRNSEDDLYVITETLETMEERKCVEYKEAEGRFSLAASIISKLNLQIGMEGSTHSLKGIIVPKAATVAFRVYQLMLGKPLRLKSGGSLELRFRGESETEYQQRKIKKEYANLLSLPANDFGKFLMGFVAIMRDMDLLQELELQLEEALDTDQLKLETDKPELQGLVGSLHLPNGAFAFCLADSILYFLRALEELTELQLLLLAESVEKKIISTQLALVGNILYGECGYKEGNFTVDARLVSPFTDDDLNLTIVMIEPTGVTLQKVGPCLAGTRDPDAFLALCPLHVALCILAELQRKA